MPRIPRTQRVAMGLCIENGCKGEHRPDRVHCEYHGKLVNERRKKYTLSYKLRALDAYGGRVCFGCGETELCVLSLDHINGGGHQHRLKEGVGSGTPFYQWLIRNNFPEGYRVLCMNCQFRAKHGAPFPNKR